jgi:hypothetical protein
MKRSAEMATWAADHHARLAVSATARLVKFLFETHSAKMADQKSDGLEMSDAFGARIAEDQGNRTA